MKNDLILIEGKFYERCSVLVVPTNNERSLIGMSIFSQETKLFFADKDGIFKGYSTENLQNCELYVLSKGEIKAGDWVYREDNHSIFNAGLTITDAFIECPNIMGAEGVQKKVCSKIIATTNPSLKFPIPESIAEYPFSYTQKSLPRTSDEFLKAYCKIDGKVKGVLVEHIPVPDDKFLDKDGFIEVIGFGKVHVNNYPMVKVSPDNTITIRPLDYGKYDKQQIKVFLYAYLKDNTGNNWDEMISPDVWIDKNL